VERPSGLLKLRFERTDAVATANVVGRLDECQQFHAVLRDGRQPIERACRKGKAARILIDRDDYSKVDRKTSLSEAGRAKSHCRFRPIVLQSQRPIGRTDPAVVPAQHGCDMGFPVCDVVKS
jgi:hypothetical protein